MAVWARRAIRKLRSLSYAVPQSHPLSVEEELRIALSGQVIDG
jgi:hypothetical protein